MDKRLSANATYLAPVLASLAFGIFCAILISASKIETYPAVPFSEGTFGFFGSFGNAIYFVILAGTGASIFYILIKRRSHRLIRIVTGFALTVAVFMLSMVYLYPAFLGFDVPYPDLLVVVASALLTLLANYAIFKGSVTFASIAVLFLGGALGTFLGFTIPTASTALILSFLAVYDVFAVYRGPVGKIAHSGLDQLRGLSYSFKDVQVGLGDLTFYSMLSGHMFLNFGFLSCFASVAGIMVGCVLSFRMLEKKGMFPGLPFPVFLGLSAGFLSSLAFVV